MRNQIGDIKDDEVTEVNQVFGDKFFTFKIRSRSGESKKLYAFDKNMMVSAIGRSSLLFGITLLTRLSKIWMLASTTPLIVSLTTNHYR